MAHLRHGRCRCGERLRAEVPHGHRQMTTFVTGRRRTGMVAPMALDNPYTAGTTIVIAGDRPPQTRVCP